MNFIEGFLNHCQKHGDLVAIVDNNGERKTTYGQLFIMSKKIAKKLISIGVKKNDNVVICLPRCMEYMAAIYGVIFAGGCYVPLSDNYPADRKKFIINETEAKAIVDNDFIGDIDSFDMVENILTTEDQNISVLYTSGSTGIPKGVLSDFLATDMFIKRINAVLEKNEHKSHLLISPFYFVAHNTALFQLSNDDPAILHLISEEKTRDSKYLLEYLDKYRVEWTFIIPSIFKYINNAKYLKTVVLGGEKVSNVYSDKMDMFCVYASTEGIFFNYKINKMSTESIVGKPAQFTLKILDDNGNEVKKGEDGEICGIGKFSNCYYKDEALTKKTFVELPNGDTLLHTNDIGHLNENGELVFVARKDEMLKIAGKRVEPGEIENVIKSIDGIDECVVKNVQVNNAKKLCAFYTTKNEQFISGNKIIEKIHKKIPSYMIPDKFVYKEEMLKNGNGKIDKLSLAVDNDININTKIEPAENEFEKIIIDAFKKVLGEDLNIGRNDDFFFLGGNSILTMSLVNLLNEYDIGFQDIYRYRTPQKIAAFCKKYDEKELEKENELALKKEQPIRSISNKQFIESQINNPKRNTGSIIPMIIEIKKDSIDLDKLAKSTYEVFKMHPAISSIIIKDENDGYKLKYKPEILEPVGIIDKKENELEDYIKSFMALENIIGVPCYRCKIVRTEKSDYFILTHSHALSDNHSFTILFRQILEHYVMGKIPKMDYYYLYLQKLNDMYMDDENKKLISEMNKIYDSVDYVDNPKKDDDVIESEGQRVAVRYDIGQTQEAMELYAKNMEISTSTIYVAALLKTLSEYNGVKKVKCELTYNGRDEKYKQNIIGGLLSFIISFADFEKIKSNEELLKIVDKQNSLNYLNSNLINLCNQNTKQSVINLVKFDSNDVKNPFLNNFIVRQDIFLKIISGDLWGAFFFIKEPKEKCDVVDISAGVNVKYYKQESFNKFMEMYKKNLYDILQL